MIPPSVDFKYTATAELNLVLDVIWIAIYMRYTRYSRRYTRYTCDIHGDIRDICDITAISPIYARCTRYTARCTRYTARCTRYTRYPARYTRYARYTPIYTISRAIYAIYTRYKTEKLKSACAGPWSRMVPGVRAQKISRKMLTPKTCYTISAQNML